MKQHKRDPNILIMDMNRKLVGCVYAAELRMLSKQFGHKKQSHKLPLSKSPCWIFTEQNFNTLVNAVNDIRGES